MPGNKAYKGFRYQKKCAFLYLLRDLAKPSGLRHFRMEHAHGDDFDLLYDTVWKVHQTKDTAAPATGTCLRKMWCKYSEDIRPYTPGSIELWLLFSKDHASDGGFKAIRDRNHADPSLAAACQRLSRSRKVTMPPTPTDWAQFLGLLGLRVLDASAIEDEITERCYQRFAYFKPSQEQLETFIKSFLRV